MPSLAYAFFFGIIVFILCSLIIVEIIEEYQSLKHHKELSGKNIKLEHPIKNY